jgi:hypothetical protein
MRVSAAHQLANKAMAHPAGPVQSGGPGVPTVYGRPATGLPPLARPGQPSGGPMGAPAPGMKDGGYV